MYGLDAAQLDTVQRAELELACLRRKQWEARLQAVEIVGLLGKALGGGKGSPPAKRVSAATMLSMLGEA